MFQYAINTLLIAGLFFIVGCRSGSENYHAPGDTENSSTSPTPLPKTTEPAIYGKVDRIDTLADFESSEFYSEYKLYKGTGWKLNTGAYNNTYETSAISNISIEVQTIDSIVIGLGLVFYERSSLQNADLDLIYKLLQSIDTKVKIDSKVKDYIKTNVEKSVFQIKRATPTTFGKLKIYAGQVGPEQTISVEKNK